MIRKIYPPMILVSIAAVLVACSSGRVPAAPIPNIGGPWEFIAASSSNKTVNTGIEVALKAGQSLVNGVEQPNGQVSATGAAQITAVSIDTSTGAITFGGSCLATGGGTYSLDGSISALGGPFNFTYMVNGNVFNVSAMLGQDGKSVIGTYGSAAGSGCADSGTITGTVVPKLSGTYVGQLTLPDGTSDSVTATLSEDSNSNLTVSIVSTAPDNTSFTLTGPVTGNALAVLGTFQGQQVSYAGYFEQVLDPIQQIMVPGVYFVNSTNASQPAYAGTLIPPEPAN